MPAVAFEKLSCEVKTIVVSSGLSAGSATRCIKQARPLSKTLLVATVDVEISAAVQLLKVPAAPNFVVTRCLSIG